MLCKNLKFLSDYEYSQSRLAGKDLKVKINQKNQLSNFLIDKTFLKF